MQFFGLKYISFFLSFPILASLILVKKKTKQKNTL